jgi:hypothetical protein
MIKKGQPCRRDIEPHLVLLIRYIKMSNILLLPPNKQIFTKILSLEDDGKGMQRIKRIKRKGSKTKRKKGIKRKKGTIRHRIL